VNFKVISDSKSKAEYIYLALVGTDLSSKVWNKLLQRINDECRQCGYERIMIDLGKLTVPVSVATVYRAASSPVAIRMLPFRLAWVNSDEAWMSSWKSLELVMRNRALPWRSFSNRKSAEIWLTQDRRASLHLLTQKYKGQILPTN
jgi:hypothetical protein